VCLLFRADIGLIGLAVMGQNLILNMNDHGFTVCAYNRTTEKVDAFLKNEAKGRDSMISFCAYQSFPCCFKQYKIFHNYLFNLGTKVIGAHSLEELVSKLKTPRRIMMLVKGEFIY
jgi:6-phosphogluconate dehydrogenase